MFGFGYPAGCVYAQLTDIILLLCQLAEFEVGTGSRVMDNDLPLFDSTPDGKQNAASHGHGQVKFLFLTYRHIGL
jgi:hypothetical protein